ncbi:Cadherin cytoplasmic C-terminal [Pristimantis euphronides]
MDIRGFCQCWKWQVVCSFLLCSWGWVSGQLRYSIVEESEPGTLVGNVAQDLGIKRAELSQRRIHLRSEQSQRYLSVHQENGGLAVKDRIDRESLCGASPRCLLQGEVVAENPVEIFSLEIEILDINDNSPTFSSNHRIIEITEVFTSPGARFALEIAKDLDVGVNGVSQYTLNTNPYFSLSVKNRKDGTLIPQLILEKVLDREEKQEHHLILTAIDGGEPARSGSCRITIVVLDINDNPPVFNQSVYKVSIRENLPLRTVILTLNATDQDDGANGEIQFYFDDHTSDSAREMFSLNEQNGEISINEPVDFEEQNFYELSIKAIDKGLPKLEGNCIVQVELEDVNDNSPEITFTSVANNIPEKTPLGNVIGFITVRDKDSGKNGEIKLDLSPNVPFRIRSNQNRYSLVVDGNLDREETPQYTIELTASDLGSPPLYSKTSITLTVSDINDNAPLFTQTTYNAFIKENSDPGTLLCTVSATDLDEGINAELVYSIVETQIEGSSVSSYVYIHSNDGNIYAQRSFDYEQIQVLQITIKVEDSGSPHLSSTVPVFLFILDTNDNPPTLLYPEHSEDLIVQERIPKSTSAGYLVTKLSAVDLDSGHNAWLLFTLIDPINYSWFQVSKHTGEVRTVRGLQETENMEQQLVISISDQGSPPLSTTVTVLVSIADEVIVERPKSGDFLTNSKPPSDMTLYLIVSLVAISLVSLVTFMILLVKCLRKDTYDWSSSCCLLGGSQSKSYTDQYQPALYLNTDGTLKYMEVRMVPPGSQGQSYQTHLPPAPEQQDFSIVQPINYPQLKDVYQEASNEGGPVNEPNNVNMDIRGFCQCWKWQVVCSFLLCSWGWVSGQLRYSIVEESEPGTLVGNVAQDLGIKRAELSQRRIHLRSEQSQRYLSVHQENGGLAVKDRIDRESLCGASPRCLLQGEVVAENPGEIFSLEIEILDINDNSPTFSSHDQIIEITELLAGPGVQFPLEIAEDLDVGVNGVSQYTLNTNPYFSLSVKNRKDGTLIPQLILEKVLDREEKQEHHLILTAIDGGEPARSGSCRITIVVLDINDNPPVFNQSVYKVSIRENLPLRTVILTLNATDQDDGANGEIQFTFDDHTSKSAREIFSLNEQNGEISIIGLVDFEEKSFFELSIKAEDKGFPKLKGNCYSSCRNSRCE